MFLKFLSHPWKLDNLYYHIWWYHSFLGKERIFTAIAQEIKAKIWGSTEKVRVLKTLSDPIIDSNLTRISCDAQIHVVEMHKVHSVRFHEILIRKFLQPISILMQMACIDHKTFHIKGLVHKKVVALLFFVHEKDQKWCLD